MEEDYLDNTPSQKNVPAVTKMLRSAVIDKDYEKKLDQAEQKHNCPSDKLSSQRRRSSHLHIQRTSLFRLQEAIRREPMSITENSATSFESILLDPPAAGEYLYAGQASEFSLRIE